MVLWWCLAVFRVVSRAGLQVISSRSPAGRGDRRFRVLGFRVEGLVVGGVVVAVVVVGNQVHAAYVVSDLFGRRKPLEHG